MRIPLLAVLLGGGFNTLGYPDGADEKVPALSKDTPAYVVGPKVYSTSTLYTTSYFTITECASGAIDCPTNALNVVTSAVLATTTTTICLTSDLPTPSNLPEGSAAASLSLIVSVGLPSATYALPSPAITSSNALPSGSGYVPAPGFPPTSSHGILPVPSSGAFTGPGSTLPSNWLPDYPSGSGFAPSLGAPMTSNIGPNPLPSGSGYVPAPGFPSTSSHGILPVASSGAFTGPGSALPSNWLPDYPTGSGFAPSLGAPVTSNWLPDYPSGSGFAPSLGASVTSNIGHLPIPTSGIPIGPGPIVTPQSPSAAPSGSGYVSGLPTTSVPGNVPAPSFEVPIGSGFNPSSTAFDTPSGSGSSPYRPESSTSVHTAPVSSGYYVPIPGESTVTMPGAPPTSYPLGPGFPQPQSSAWAPSVPASNGPLASASNTGPSPTLSFGHPSSGVFPVPTATNSNNGYPFDSTSGSPGVPSSSYPPGAPYSPKPTAIPSGTGFVPSETSTMGIKTSSLTSSPIGTSNPNATVTASTYPQAPGWTSMIPQPTPSGTEEGTATTQITNIVTYPYTTFTMTVPLQTSGRNYSTETEGIHTSIGTDASAYIPTGTGWWPSATANGTFVSPTPNSPIPYNNEGQQTIGSGKSSIVAIVVALAFVHFI